MENEEKKEAVEESKEISKPEKENAADSGERDASEKEDNSALNPIARAEKAVSEGKAIAERIEAANKEAKDIIARGILSGRALGPQPIEEKKESAKEYAERVMAGKVDLK